MNVTVNYTGRLLNGEVFDSNVDSTFGHMEPFKFTTGFRQVIEGWDIAVRAMKVGEKAKVYIPSMLAYGMQGSGSKIPPYSHLVFDIEVLSAEVFEPEQQ
jgi:FKBP-type peptidyl-prolyl cis-trans isomerase FkpA